MQCPSKSIWWTEQWWRTLKRKTKIWVWKSFLGLESGNRKRNFLNLGWF